MGKFVLPWHPVQLQSTVYVFDWNFQMPTHIFFRKTLIGLFDAVIDCDGIYPGMKE